MATEWFYTTNGQQAASPVSDGQLRQMAASGQLVPTDLVWKDGMANWVAANTIKGLFPSSKNPAPAELPEPEPVARNKSSRRRVTSEPTRERDDRPEREGRPEREDLLDREDRPNHDAPSGLLGMHPILVLLLSICTAGIFGLIYAYIACTNFSSQQEKHADSSGRALGKLRHPLAVVILSNLTLGLYLIYWIYRTIAECADYTDRKDVNPRVELSLMLIFPPYMIYIIAFRLPELIRAAQHQANQPSAGALNVAPFFVIPCLAPGLPFLAMAYQDALNQTWVSAK